MGTCSNSQIFIYFRIFIKTRQKVGLGNRDKLQNTELVIYITLNHKSAYICVILHSSKDFDICKTGAPKWPFIL